MKKLFTKFILLVLTLSLAVCFVACGDGDDAEKEVTGTYNYQLVSETRFNEETQKEEVYKYYKITGYQVSEEDTLAMSEGDFSKIDKKYREIEIPKTHNNLNVEEIDSAAFANQIILTKITVGSHIKKIGEGAFSGCTNLEYIELPFIGKSIDATNEERVFGYLFGAGATGEGNTEITSRIHCRKSSVDGSEIVTEEDVVFYIPTSLKEVVVTEQEVISECAFYGMTTLEKVNYKKATVVDSHAFYGCASLKTFDFSLIKKVYQYAFASCTSIRSLQFGETPVLEFIDNYAFSGCTSLGLSLINEDEAKLTIKLPSTLKEISKGAFADCAQIKYLNIASATKINSLAFSNCFALKKVILNETATFGDSVFSGCTELDKDQVFDVSGNVANIADINRIFGETDKAE